MKACPSVRLLHSHIPQPSGRIDVQFRALFQAVVGFGESSESELSIAEILPLNSSG